MCTVWSRFFYWRKILVKADLSNTFNMVMASVENFLETLQKKFYLQNITIRRNFNSILRDLLRNVFHAQIMFLKWFPTILRSFEAKVFDKKSEKMTFGQAKKLSLEHFLGTVFNSFVHFLQYFHFYASYDSDFFTYVLPGLWGMFFIPRSCCWNDFPPFCGHLKQKFSKKSLKKWLLDKLKNRLWSIF